MIEHNMLEVNIKMWDDGSADIILEVTTENTEWTERVNIRDLSDGSESIRISEGVKCALRRCEKRIAIHLDNKELSKHIT